MSRLPGTGRPGQYPPSAGGGYQTHPTVNRAGSAGYLSRGSTYGQDGSSNSLGNTQQMNPGSQYSSTSSMMGSTGSASSSYGNLMGIGSGSSIIGSRSMVSTIWENRPPENVPPLNTLLLAPDYFPFTRNAPEENMRSPFIDQGYFEPFTAGEENEYGSMRDRIAYDFKQIQGLKVGIDSRLKDIAALRLLIRPKTKPISSGQMKKRVHPPWAQSMPLPEAKVKVWWEKLANLDNRLALLSAVPDQIPNVNSGKWEVHIRSMWESNVPLDRACWYIKILHLHKFYQSQTNVTKYQKDATMAWTKAISSFISTQLRAYAKKLAEKPNERSSMGEKAKQLINYSIRLLHWTYTEGIVAPDDLFSHFLLHLLQIVEPMQQTSSVQKPIGSNFVPTVEVELWYLGIITYYSHDICLSQVNLRLLYRYCVGRAEQLVPYRNGVLIAPASPAHGKIYSAVCSLLRVIIASAADFVVLQGNCELLLDRLAETNSILAAVSEQSSAADATASLKSSQGESGVTPADPMDKFPNLQQKPLIVLPHALPYEISQKFENKASVARSRDALLRSMNLPPSSSKIKIIDLLDGWNKYSDMKSFCDAVLEAARSRQSSAASPSSSTTPSATTKQQQSIISPQTLVNLICDWALSPFRSLLDIFAPFVASALLKRLAATPDWSSFALSANSSSPRPSPLSNKMLVSPTTGSVPSSLSNTSAPTKVVDVASLLLIYLDNLVPLGSGSLISERAFFYRMARLFGELTRCNLFSHDKYMRSLISRGLMDRPAGSEDERSTRHRKILEELPIYGDNAQDRMQRRMLLFGTGAGSVPTDESVSSAAVAMLDRWIQATTTRSSTPSMEDVLVTTQSLPLYHQVLVADLLVAKVKALLDIDSETPPSLPVAMDLFRRTLTLLEAQGDYLVLLSFLVWALQDAFFGSEYVAISYVYKYERLFVCAERLVELLQCLHDRFDELETTSHPNAAAAMDQTDKLISALVLRYAKVSAVENWKANSITNATLRQRHSAARLMFKARASKPVIPDFETELSSWMNDFSSAPDSVARLVTDTDMIPPLLAAVFRAVLAKRADPQQRAIASKLLALVADVRRRFVLDTFLGVAVGDALQTVLTSHLEDDSAAFALIFFTSQLVVSATMSFDQLLSNSAGRFNEVQRVIPSPSLVNPPALPHTSIVWQIRFLFDWICMICCSPDRKRLPQNLKSLIGPEDAAAIASCASSSLSSTNQSNASFDCAFAILQLIHTSTQYLATHSAMAESVLQTYVEGDALDLSPTFIVEAVFSSPASKVYNFVKDIRDPPGSYSLFYRHLLARNPDLSGPLSQADSFIETTRLCFAEVQSILLRTNEWNVRQSWLELQLVLDCGIFAEKRNSDKPQTRSDIKTLNWFARVLLDAVSRGLAPSGPVLERLVSYLTLEVQNSILSLCQEILDSPEVMDGSISATETVRAAAALAQAESGIPAPMDTDEMQIDDYALLDTLTNLTSQLGTQNFNAAEKRQFVTKIAGQMESISHAPSSSLSKWTLLRMQVYLRCVLLRRFMLHSRQFNLQIQFALGAASEKLLASLLRLLIHPMVLCNVVDSLDLRTAVLYALDSYVGDSAAPGPSGSASAASAGGAVVSGATMGSSQTQAEEKSGPRPIVLRLDERGQLIPSSLVSSLRSRLEQIIPALERRESLVFNVKSRHRKWMMNKVSIPIPSAASIAAATSSSTSSMKLDPWSHLLDSETDPGLHGDTATALATPALRLFNPKIVGPRRDLTYAKGLFDDQTRSRSKAPSTQFSLPPSTVPITPKSQHQPPPPPSPAAQQQQQPTVAPKQPQHTLGQHSHSHHHQHTQSQGLPSRVGVGSVPIKEEQRPQAAPGYAPHPQQYMQSPSVAPMPPTHAYQQQKPVATGPHQQRGMSFGQPPPPPPGPPPPPPPPPQGPYGYQMAPPPPPPVQYQPRSAPPGQYGPEVILPQLPPGPGGVKRQRDIKSESELTSIGGYTPMDQKQRGYNVKPGGGM